MFPTQRLPTPWVSMLPTTSSREGCTNRVTHTTQSYSGLYADALPDVYPPSEDTFLFLDCLLRELPDIFLSKPMFVLEMGSGSGCLITYLMLLLQRANQNCAIESEKVYPFFWAVDIHTAAAKQTRHTAETNGAAERLDVLTGDLFTCFKASVTFDLILFNPIIRVKLDGVDANLLFFSQQPTPYVPSTHKAATARDIDASWAGGEAGRYTIDLFLANAIKRLSHQGVLYLLLEKQNKPLEVVEYMETCGYASFEVLQRRAFNETLSLWKFTKYPVDSNE